MATRVAVSTLNASTIDILNVIRQNATYDYQAAVPEVTSYADIPKVGEIIYGTPAFANQFLNALVNRIALVRANSATFNNPYSRLKKGYLEFGETVEEIFVNIAKVVDYRAEEGENMELKRTMPDVRSAFHVMNWRALYPVTIQDEDLKQAFLSAEGVSSLIAKIVDSVYTAAEYDEFLLMKYLLIKGYTQGLIKKEEVGADVTNAELAATFRGISNVLPFMGSKYNAQGVMTTTPKERQIIFMDARYNATFDVDVLSAAFNMDRANFMGSLYLVDDWTTFDNDRFEVIRAHSDGLEQVTDDELALMANVKAIILDENWFQVYDNNNKFTEKYVASGLYWNYFYHTWKTVSMSPFSNAVAVTAIDEAEADSITVHVDSVDESDEAITIGFSVVNDGVTVNADTYLFVQTEELTAAGIAVQSYGALLIPTSQIGTEITLVAVSTTTGSTYTATTTITGSGAAIDTTITLTKN